MLTQHIALVPEADGIEASELARVSAALQKQVTRDLGPARGVNATVDAFPRLEDVPAGYWPILITRCDVGMQSGVHLDRDGTPYAQIEHSSEWSIDASRACLEMLVNPFGKRTVNAPSPRSDQGRVDVVVEICGPCGDALCAYAINDVVVSDFCLPAYYEEGPITIGKRLSLNGSVGTPFSVLPGGHLTWFDLVTESYWRRSHWGENPVDTRLGRLLNAASSSRELGPRSLPARLRASSPAHEAFQARVELERQHTKRISELRALRLRASLVEPSGDAPQPGLLEPHAAKMPAAPRILLLQEEREPESVTAIDITDEQPTRTATSTPPPLPARASRPPRLDVPSTAPAAPTPQAYKQPQAQLNSPSTAPVTLIREPDKADRNAPGLIALGMLAAAFLVFFITRSNEPANSPSAPPAATTTSTTSTTEAASAPAPVQAPAVVPAPATPTEAPVAITKESPAKEPPKATLKKAKLANRSESTPKTRTLPAPAEPNIAEKSAENAQPVLTMKPSAAPQPVAAAQPSEPASIDALIDTRR